MTRLPNDDRWLAVIGWGAILLAGMLALSVLAGCAGINTYTLGLN